MMMIAVVIIKMKMMIQKKSQIMLRWSGQSTKKIETDKIPNDNKKVKILTKHLVFCPLAFVQTPAVLITPCHMLSANFTPHLL